MSSITANTIDNIFFWVSISYNIAYIENLLHFVAKNLDKSHGTLYLINIKIWNGNNIYSWEMYTIPHSYTKTEMSTNISVS